MIVNTSSGLRNLEIYASINNINVIQVPDHGLKVVLIPQQKPNFI